MAWDFIIDHSLQKADVLSSGGVAKLIEMILDKSKKDGKLEDVIGKGKISENYPTVFDRRGQDTP